MEVQLQELIDKIKSEGVASAKADAEQIIAQAHAKAKAIVAAAEANAAEAMDNVKKEEALADQRGREAMTNAGRDLLLNLSGRITTMFDAALLKNVNDAMSGDALVSMIKNILSGLSADKAYEISLSPADATKMAEQLKASLASMAKGGLDVKPTKMIDAGFRLSEKDGSIFYDFSSEIIAANLSAYVNPILAADLKKAAGVK